MKSILKGIGLAVFILLDLAGCFILAYGENVTSGTGAGARITTGDANVFIGESAGAYTTTGVGNIFVGYSTGNRNTTGSRNIYLGYLSGMGLTGSDRFVLRNYPYNTVLYAHMDSQLVAINATNALGYNLYVSGTAKITGATTYSTVTADSITSGRFLSSLTGGANNAAISPSGDKDTGLYWLAATGNRIGVTAKGTQVALFDSVGTGVITGTAAAPSLHNLNDRDTGLYWLAATGNRLGMTAKGVSHAIIDSIGMAVRGKVEIWENVIPLTDSLLVLRDSLGNTKIYADSLGKVHADTLHATNIVATGYGIVNGSFIGRAGATITGSATADTTKGTNAAFTGYGIVDGAGIVRGGLTVTGSASADTTKGTNAAFTGYAIVNGATILRGTVSAALDSANNAVNSLAIGDVASLSTRLGEKVVATALSDSFYNHIGKKWLVHLPDYCDTTASAKDSTTVKVVADLNGLEGRKKLLYVYGNGSAAADSTIWVSTFNPKDVNPDSLIVWAYTTDEVNTSFSVEIYNSAGTIVYSSGNLTMAAASTWTYKGVAFATFADTDEHALVYRVRVLNAADAVQIGQTYFKRN